ncbi:hypothetical protein SAQ01S_07060 [Sphingomonas aquatilis NBRC 16722]|uniref:DNA transfer protein n=1 Tax=Sphingomonas aquatilis TaxID=93063 RepID=A0AAW3TQX9_9SPHN|nr:hypothetical protein [Sphingomonas aquatilis]MBB3876088.1 hypothetical protein [Sphingomonas aquatilis]GEM70940.1 hypothetical protein SAQ01S_07060 [Sphingomonas aquatilis NBRC 16722]
MSGKSTTTTGPSKAALPYIQSATNAAQSGYNRASDLANISTTILQQQLPGVVASTINNPTLGAANDYTQAVLGGKFLTGNPQLDKQIATTNADVTNGVNGAIGSRGLAGGSAQSQILARELAKNETNLRYTDYNNERSRMDNAVGNATSLAGAGNQGIAALLAYLTGMSELPQNAANNYASSIGSLWGNSTTTTQKTSPSLGAILAQIAGNAAAAGKFG